MKFSTESLLYTFLVLIGFVVGSVGTTVAYLVWAD